MSDRRQVWATLAALLQRLEAGSTAASSAAVSSALAPAPELDNIQQEVRKLGKAQFKANTLAESQVAQLQETLAALQATQAQNEQLLQTLQQEQQVATCRKLLEAVLPALDGLENAINSGQQYLARRDQAAARPDLTPAQARLVSPADRAMLAGWLDGLRLVQDRLLAVLAAGDVTPIPTVGQAFDPYLHRAVGTMTQGDGTPGTIVGEERRGYRSPAGVLRYADVIVYKPESG